MIELKNEKEVKIEKSSNLDIKKINITDLSKPENVVLKSDCYANFKGEYAIQKTEFIKIKTNNGEKIICEYCADNCQKIVKNKKNTCAFESEIK